MSFLNPGLLAGLLVAGIPLLLHLLMRARPQPFDFPALRLIQKIRKQNTQRLRIRHLLLLLLRMFLLIFLVLALVRPTLPAANYQLSAGDWLRLFGCLVTAGAGYLVWRFFLRSSSAGWNRQLQSNPYLQSATWLVIFLVACLIVGWPYQQRIRAEITKPGDQRQLNLPVAAVLIFDCSVSMDYRYENETRIAVAKQLALEQLRDLPAGSKIGITENAAAQPVLFLPDEKAAQARIQRLSGTARSSVSVPLNNSLLAAINLQRADRNQVAEAVGNGAETDESLDQFVREIYLYTDRTVAAWSWETIDRIRTELELSPWLQCYLIDVGSESITNLSVTDLELSAEQTVAGSPVRISCQLNNQSAKQESILAELYGQDATGDLQKRDQRSVEIGAGETQQISFTQTAISLGMMQGVIRISQSDPLVADNELPFTIQVYERPRLWVVADFADEAFVWQTALAPAEFVKRGVHQYDVEVLKSAQVSRRLEAAANERGKLPAVIYLLNVARLSEQSWQSLQSFTKNGGGLGIVLGSSRIDVQNYRQAGQAEWLPAIPTVHSRAVQPISWEVVRADHPVFDYLKKNDGLSLFSTAGVYRYWKTEAAAQAEVLARFSDAERTVAMIGRIYGRGKVVVLSTAVDLSGSAQQKQWSDLARLGWIYLAWADQWTRYLQAGEKSTWNQTAGQNITIKGVNPARTEGLLQAPGLIQGQIPIPYASEHLRIFTEAGDVPPGVIEGRKNQQLDPIQAGNYRLVFSDNPQENLAFSVQLESAETNFLRLSDSQLDEIFGAGRWQSSRSLSELERTVLLGRLGQEAYPMIMVLVMLAFLLEHWTANWFYGTSER